MTILIIEDELLAQQKLETMLQHLNGNTKVLAKLGSVKETVQWLSQHQRPDLAFVDIQLSDDHSFEIFRQFPVEFPVIFTTAYDKYLLESFEFNAIDYLLKPITEEKLKRSLEKLRRLENHFLQGNILKLIQQQKPDGMSRLIAKKGTEFIALNIDSIAYFYTEHKIVFVRDFEGRQFIVDGNLSDFETQLDKQKFFRINRKYLSSLKGIEKFKPDNGKIRVFLTPEMKEEIHVSKENAPAFREWISGMKE
jgi:DNA-binding LytR/AlgR family response regulator